MFKTIMFDLDGTLVDTKELILVSFRETVQNYLGKVISEDEFIKTCYGEPLQHAMARLCPDKAEELVNYYIKHNHSIHDDYIKPFPGVKETLQELKNKGISMGVVTSKRYAGAVKALEFFKIKDYFSVIIAGDDVKIHKPNPYPLELAMEKIGANKDETLMVGDTLMDIECAKNAGVKSVLVGWTIIPMENFNLIPPDYIIQSFSDIINIIED